MKSLTLSGYSLNNTPRERDRSGKPTGILQKCLGLAAIARCHRHSPKEKNLHQSIKTTNVKTFSSKFPSTITQSQK